MNCRGKKGVTGHPHRCFTFLGWVVKRTSVLADVVDNDDDL
jgi:hypothetical protein